MSWVLGLLAIGIIIDNIGRPAHEDPAGEHRPWGGREDLGGGADTVGNPHRAQFIQFELFELFSFLHLDNEFSIERFEPTVSQSTVSSPPRRTAFAGCVCDLSLPDEPRRTIDELAQQLEASEVGMIRLETLIELELLNFRAFRACPLIEIRRAILYRAIRADSISVKSSLPPSPGGVARRAAAATGLHQRKRNPRPRPQKFSKSVFGIYFSQFIVLFVYTGYLGF